MYITKYTADKQNRANNKMINTGTFLLLLSFFLLSISSSNATSRDLPLPHSNSDPQPNPSFTISQQQNQQSACSYRVSIKTSCSSSRYTRDQISLSFGDAYGYQVYAPRIDNPSSRAFESCSTDTYTINGPCTYQVCYLYLYRSGYDGWKPESVTVSGYYTKTVTFRYNTWIPNNLWYGFNYCNGISSSDLKVRSE